MIFSTRSLLSLPVCSLVSHGLIFQRPMHFDSVKRIVIYTVDIPLFTKVFHIYIRQKEFRQRETLNHLRLSLKNKVK